MTQFLFTSRVQLPSYRCAHVETKHNNGFVVQWSSTSSSGEDEHFQWIFRFARTNDPQGRMEDLRSIRSEVNFCRGAALFFAIHHYLSAIEQDRAKRQCSYGLLLICLARGSKLFLSLSSPNDNLRD